MINPFAFCLSLLQYCPTLFLTHMMQLKGSRRNIADLISCQISKLQPITNISQKHVKSYCCWYVAETEKKWWIIFIKFTWRRRSFIHHKTSYLYFKFPAQYIQYLVINYLISKFKGPGLKYMFRYVFMSNVDNQTIRFFSKSQISIWTSRIQHCLGYNKKNPSNIWTIQLNILLPLI